MAGRMAELMVRVQVDPDGDVAGRRDAMVGRVYMVLERCSGRRSLPAVESHGHR